MNNIRKEFFSNNKRTKKSKMTLTDGFKTNISENDRKESNDMTK